MRYSPCLFAMVLKEHVESFAEARDAEVTERDRIDARYSSALLNPSDSSTRSSAFTTSASSGSSIS